VPQPLVDQLKEGGRLVAPVGDRQDQNLVKVIKRARGSQTTVLTACAFVPLIGTHGWPLDTDPSAMMFGGGLA
jgi:protein-L-isoaspartate(D-aspartate) O-methyltransferase